MHEWSLLIFTVCMQAAIGGVLMLWLFQRKMAKLGEAKIFEIIKVPLLVMAGLSLAGLLASFTHLGSPGNAFNTIRHLGSSWMSREILVTGMFIAMICITAGLAISQKKINPSLLLISALIGLVDVFCMAAIYTHTLVSGWNSVNTYTSFYGTALVLGPVLAASFVIPALRARDEKEAHGIVRNAFYVAIFGIAVQLIGVTLFATAMPEVNMITGTNAMLALEGYQGAVALRWIIEIIGLGVLGYMAMAPAKKQTFSFAYVSLAAVLVAETMSRYVFYVLGS